MSNHNCGPSCYIKDNVSVGEFLSATLELCGDTCTTPDFCRGMENDPEAQQRLEYARAAMTTAKSAIETALSSWDRTVAYIEEKKKEYVPTK